MRRLTDMDRIFYEALRDTLTAMALGVIIGLLIHPSLLFGRRKPK